VGGGALFDGPAPSSIGWSSSAMVRTARFERMSGGSEYTDSVRDDVDIATVTENMCQVQQFRDTAGMIDKISIPLSQTTSQVSVPHHVILRLYPFIKQSRR